MSTDVPASERHPLCTQPWQTYYILRRGIFPCCYGHHALAPMSEWRTAWNSPAMQEIRRDLARGVLGPYCLQSRSCPIVQRHLLARPPAAPPRRPAWRRAVSAVKRLVRRPPGPSRG